MNTNLFSNFRSDLIDDLFQINQEILDEFGLIQAPTM